MASKYLASLSQPEYDALTKKLLKIQNNQCFICQKKIDPVQKTNINHINPQARDGPDNQGNFAVTHEFCNKSKLDSNLNTARILAKLRDIQEITLKTEGKTATLKHILSNFDGSKYDFRYRVEENLLKYLFQISAMLQYMKAQYSVIISPKKKLHLSRHH